MRWIADPRAAVAVTVTVGRECRVGPSASRETVGVRGAGPGHHDGSCVPALVGRESEEDRAGTGGTAGGNGRDSGRERAGVRTGSRRAANRPAEGVPQPGLSATSVAAPSTIRQARTDSAPLTGSASSGASETRMYNASG